LTGKARLSSQDEAPMLAHHKGEETMPKGYVIGHVTVTDAEAYQA
jgi:hypothetical protein